MWRFFHDLYFYFLTGEPITLIQTTITGNENLKELASTVQALSLFYCAFNPRNMKLMSQNWVQSDEVQES